MVALEEYDTISKDNIHSVGKNCWKHYPKLLKSCGRVRGIQDQSDRVHQPIATKLTDHQGRAHGPRYSALKVVEGDDEVSQKVNRLKLTPTVRSMYAE
jgi:hypothetical protein